MNGVLDEGPEVKETRTAKGLLEIGKFYQGLGTYKGEGLATLVEDGKILAIPEYHIFELEAGKKVRLTPDKVLAQLEKIQI
jgi:hypothetical protein